MKQLITLFLLLVLLFGCSQQLPGGSSPSATPTPQPAPTPQPPSQPEKSGPDYIVSVSVLQFDQQVRYQDRSMYIEDKRKPVINKDNITKSYGVDVSISDVTGGAGTNKPLKNPEKAVVKLVSDKGKEMLLKYNAVSQQDYDKMPALFKWLFIVSDTPDLLASRFAYFDLNAAEKLRGTYKITVDVEGDGKVDGERDILVPGLTVTKPTYGSKESTNGFDVEWSQAGNPEDFLYDLSANEPIYYDEQLSDTTVFIEPDMIEEESVAIEPGMFLLNLQVQTGPDDTIDKDAKDYFLTGSSDKKVLFNIVSAKEAILLQFKVGDFCHCDNLFEPKGSCSVDELDADALCN